VGPRRTICDASFPTTLLTHWGRDRTRGDRIDLPELVKRQCRATAEAVGLLDRGLIAEGYRADINVIDFDHLHAGRPEMAFDLPAGGKRLLQGATGYLHTFVSGIETYSDGAPTGMLPGRLVRGQRRDPAHPGRAEVMHHRPRSGSGRLERRLHHGWRLGATPGGRWLGRSGPRRFAESGGRSVRAARAGGVGDLPAGVGDRSD